MSLQLFLIFIFCWQTPICVPKKIVTFFGRIMPSKQELFQLKEEVKKPNRFTRLFSKSKIEYEDKREMVPIIWTVEIVECVGCDNKYGPKRASDITENGAFQIRLISKSDYGNDIRKLVVKIKSADPIPMRKDANESGEWHRVRKSNWLN